MKTLMCLILGAGWCCAQGVVSVPEPSQTFTVQVMEGRKVLIKTVKQYSDVNDEEGEEELRQKIQALVRLRQKRVVIIQRQQQEIQKLNLEIRARQRELDALER